MAVTVKAKTKGQEFEPVSRRFLINSTIPSVIYVKTWRNSVLLRNISGVTIYIGGKDVTIANGFPIFDKEILAVDIAETVEIFAIAESGTNKPLAVLEV